MQLTIIAGANGSGKTTFALSFSKLYKTQFINADEIARKLNPDNIEKKRLKQDDYFSKR